MKTKKYIAIGVSLALFSMGNQIIAMQNTQTQTSTGMSTPAAPSLAQLGVMIGNTPPPTQLITNTFSPNDSVMASLSNYINEFGTDESFQEHFIDYLKTYPELDSITAWPTLKKSIFDLALDNNWHDVLKHIVSVNRDDVTIERALVYAIKTNNLDLLAQVVPFCIKGIIFAAKKYNTVQQSTNIVPRSEYSSVLTAIAANENSQEILKLFLKCLGQAYFYQKTANAQQVVLESTKIFMTSIANSLSDPLIISRALQSISPKPYQLRCNDFFTSLITSISPLLDEKLHTLRTSEKLRSTEQYFLALCDGLTDMVTHENENRLDEANKTSAAQTLVAMHTTTIDHKESMALKKMARNAKRNAKKRPLPEINTTTPPQKKQKIEATPEQKLYNYVNENYVQKNQSQSRHIPLQALLRESINGTIIDLAVTNTKLSSILTLAIATQDEELVELLLECTLDLKLRNVYQLTAINIAIQECSSLELIKKIAAKTALQITDLNEKNYYYASIFLDANCNKNLCLDLWQWFINPECPLTDHTRTDLSAMINYRLNDDMTVLMHCALYGSPAQITWLLDHGAQVMTHNSYNNSTAFHFATLNKTHCAEILTLLANKNPEGLISRNAQNKTPLDTIKKNENYVAAHTLLYLNLPALAMHPNFVAFKKYFTQRKNALEEKIKNLDKECSAAQEKKNSAEDLVRARKNLEAAQAEKNFYEQLKNK